MINLEKNQVQILKNAKYCRERNIILPTLAQMREPETIPAQIKHELKNIGLWDVHPRNLFRITWKNEPMAHGGGFGKVNYLAFPPELTGVPATIIALVGKWFPTGAHKVGATFGCLVPRLVAGQFDPTQHKAVWPSTGNFCRGGAYVSALLACKSIAILPEEMSKERFEWLAKIAGEVIATPGCESNVKEIFDKCWELRKTRTDVQIFNQFEEFGNVLWHYAVTGAALKEIVNPYLNAGKRLAGAVFSSGSAGTLGGGYFLKRSYPRMRLAVAEAWQCPTLLNNGFGGHRIEGIGDKHVPWIHDLKETDMIVGIDDEHTMRLLRFFNEKPGRQMLATQGVDGELLDKLSYLGISSICNLLAAIKMAKYYELQKEDVVVTLFTDSLDLYGSRLLELTAKHGDYSDSQAYRDAELLAQISADHVLELDYYAKKRIHNLKYYTWIEQQQRQLPELEAQWSDHDNYWGPFANLMAEVDELICEFNEMIARS